MGNATSHTLKQDTEVLKTSSKHRPIQGEGWRTSLDATRLGWQSKDYCRAGRFARRVDSRLRNPPAVPRRVLKAWWCKGTLPSQASVKPA